MQMYTPPQIQPPELTFVKVFMPQPRESHKTAFRNPHHWLHCPCCKQPPTHTITHPTQPPTTILHQLYLDSTTHLINIHDWFKAFVEVRSGEGELSEEEEFAVFMACLDELVWMGYVRRTTRKTDHVEKLVAG
jgi:origin recognition complex subunit 3